ncbi:MAG: 3-deoxy-8-phosphooctulonate synthase [Bdellovibrionota bacterium]
MTSSTSAAKPESASGAQPAATSSNASTNRKVAFPEFSIGADEPLAVICGPCVIESRDHVLRMAEAISEICRRVQVPLIFKSSYDKANRTSASGYRGLGIDAGLKILSEVRTSFQVPVISDVHTEEEAAQCKSVLDVVQIPAFLCRQTSLLEAAGQTGKAVLVKKGQFLAPEDMQFAAEKIRAGGSRHVLLCERGACFGYRDLVVDMRSLVIMRELGDPVVFDATHSVQKMGGAGGKSGGNRAFVPHLARAAVAVGVDAVFLECHDDPDHAPSDGPNMLPLPALQPLLEDLKRVHELRLHTRE